MTGLMKARIVFIMSFLALQNPSAASNDIIYGTRTLNNRILVQSTDLSVQEPARDLYTVSRSPEQRLAALTQRENGELLLIRKNVGRNVQARARLSNIDLPKAAKNLSQPSDVIPQGLERNFSIGSSIPVNRNFLLSFVGHISDTPPFTLAITDLRTSVTRLLPDFDLLPGDRYSNLTRCANGTIYATTLLREYDNNPHLARLDLVQRRFIDVAELSFEQSTIKSDLKDLACSASNQLYALADTTYSGANSLFTIDETGNMSFVRIFNVDKITFGFVQQPLLGAQGLTR